METLISSRHTTLNNVSRLECDFKGSTSFSNWNAFEEFLSPKVLHCRSLVKVLKDIVCPLEASTIEQKRAYFSKNGVDLQYVCVLRMLSESDSKDFVTTKAVGSKEKAIKL